MATLPGGTTGEPYNPNANYGGAYVSSVTTPEGRTITYDPPTGPSPQRLPLLQVADDQPVFAGGEMSAAAALEARVAHLETLVNRLLSGAE